MTRSVFLVFDFCENDLACIIDNVSNAFSEAQVKCIMMQILEGVAYCHERFILHRCCAHCQQHSCASHSRWLIALHRDLKMSNILYSGRGNVMIADFGLARKYDLPPRAYTPKVGRVLVGGHACGMCLTQAAAAGGDTMVSSSGVVVWQSSIQHRRRHVVRPRLMLGYSATNLILLRCVCGCVCRSIGCIMGELLLSAPLLPGKNELDQIKRMFQLLGAPTERLWPGGEQALRSRGHALPHTWSIDCARLLEASTCQYAC